MATATRTKTSDTGSQSKKEYWGEPSCKKASPQIPLHELSQLPKPAFLKEKMPLSVIIATLAERVWKPYFATKAPPILLCESIRKYYQSAINNVLSGGYFLTTRTRFHHVFMRFGAVIRCTSRELPVFAFPFGGEIHGQRKPEGRAVTFFRIEPYSTAEALHDLFRYGKAQPCAARCILYSDKPIKYL